MATALRGIPDVPYNVPDGVMQLKIDPLLGIMIGEDEEGIYEYFYQENPPPEVEAYLPPLEDPTAEDFPQQSIPDNMLDNPLQPQPPEHIPPPPPAPPPSPEPQGESVKAEPRATHQNATKTTGNGNSNNNSSSNNAAARAMNQ